MKYTFMRYPEGKCKAVTLSFDDGTKADMRVCDRLTEAGMKATFNLVGRDIEQEAGMPLSFIRERVLGCGHEIAVHGYLHRAMDCMNMLDATREVLDGRMVLERTFGGIIRGYAYADRCLRSDEDPEIYASVRPMLQNLGITYARTAGGDNDRFDLPKDFYQWMPSAYQYNPELAAWIDRFVALDVRAEYIANQRPRLFYIWGHANDFARDNSWDRLDDICERLGGKADIWYATNAEICEYVRAFCSLVWSADGMTVYNPTLLSVWFERGSTVTAVAPGEVVKLA